MYSKWNEKSLENYDNKVAALIEKYTVNPETCIIHIGTANSKTRMINEGTSAGLKGTCCAQCKGDCREGCYAIVHGDGVYSSARDNHAQNTIMRRQDRRAYYETFFFFANLKGKNLRINETGDFEDERDVEAFIEVAKNYPKVRVIGYTHRSNLVGLLAEANKLENVMLHFSVACNGSNRNIAIKHNVPTTEIVFDSKKATCPFQVAKMHGNKVKWSCDKCATLGCGCFSNKNVYFLAH